MEKHIDLTCSICQQIFSRKRREYNRQLKRNGTNYLPICSQVCRTAAAKQRNQVSCETCQIVFEKRHSQIINSTHHFCSRSCAAIYNNKHVVKSKAKDKTAICVECELPIVISGHVNPKIARCAACKKPRRASPAKIPSSKVCSLKAYCCITCGILLAMGFTNKQYCDPCRKIARHIGGLKSAAIQAVNRRSQNEAYFADLCLKEFKSVATNEAIFVSKYGNWDADVIIHDHKIAVLWNGIWHYKQVREKHSVKQVQARDKIKMDVIVANGYIPYVIKDMGKHNKSFVESEFVKFKQYILDLQ